MATRKTVKQKADIIAAAVKKQTAAKTENGTPVSNAKTQNHVKILSRYPRDVAFNMPDGRRVIVRGSTFVLRGKDTGVLDFSRVQDNIIDSNDWEYIKGKFGGMKLFKNGYFEALPVNISHSEEKAVVRAMADSLPPVGLESVDPEKAAVKPFVAD